MKKLLFVSIIVIVLLSGCVDSNEVTPRVYDEKQFNGFKSGDHVKSTNEFEQKYNDSFIGHISFIHGLESHPQSISITTYQPDPKQECEIIDNITYCTDIYSDFDMGLWIEVFDTEVIVQGVSEYPHYQNIYVYNTSWIEHV